MIIDVKGTKSTGETNGPASRQTYTLKEVRLSKLPWAFGAFLFGIAAYLKSVLPSWGRLPPEETEVGPQEESMAARLKLVVGGLMDPPREPEEPQSAEQAKDKVPVLGSGGSYSTQNPSAEFMLVDSPPIRFAGPADHRTDISKLASFGVALSSANDNFAGGGTSGGSVVDPVTPAGRTPHRDPRPADEESDDRETDGLVDPTPVKTEPKDPHPVDDDPNGEVEPDMRNRAPRTSGPVRLYDVYGCAAILIALSDLLSNATDPDGDTLSIRNLSVSSGTIVRSGANWLYDPGGLGPVTVTYEITDGKVSIVQHAYFTVVESPPIIGTDGDDILVGAACADRIEGRDGDDNIDGRGGNDVIDGGSGDDHIVGGAGNDVLVGGAGSDVIFGGAGNDQISGGSGNDRLFGDQGDDTIFGDSGNDHIDGGEGNDLLFGGAGADVMSGGAGADSIHGESSDDSLSGGEGNDLIAGGGGDDSMAGGAGDDVLLDGAGQDTVSGGEGDDRVIVALDDDKDTFDGGSGTDTLDLSAAEQGVDVDLTEGSASGTEIGSNEIEGFEIVEAGSGNDTLAGATGDDTLLGGDGDDAVMGGDGDDAVMGQAGDDSLSGGDGRDTLDGGTGDDRLSDGAGQDTVNGGSGEDLVEAAADGADDVYDGGEGCDVLDYSATEQGVLIDLAEGKSTGVEIGSDTIDNFERLIGGDGDDHFVSGGQSATFEGGAGEDLFEFNAPQAPAQTSVYYAIVDFEAGDRIKMSKYDIFDAIEDELGDQFEAVYGEKLDLDDGRLRYRYESNDHLNRTVIEADLDRDRTYETTVYLDGHRALIIVEDA